MQALIEGFGKRPQFAWKVRSDPRNRPIRTQVGQLHADALQHDHDAPNHEQRQACGQERRQHDTAQEREVDAPFGLIPIPTFCCHNQQSRFLTSYRSEEHTSELQSPCNLVCRLLLEKKKNRLQSPARALENIVERDDPTRFTLPSLRPLHAPCAVALAATGASSAPLLAIAVPLAPHT